MNALRQDIHSFSPNHFGTLSDLLQDSECNVQDTLMVACADHGTAPDNVSFAGPNRLFIVQNMAASVPAASSLDSSSILGSIEYAIRVLHVKHAIICGHLGCGIIPAWLRIPMANTRNDVQSNFNKDARAVVDETYAPADADERIALTICEHALFQLENLQSHDFVQARLQVGDLRLHAWLVDDQTARVECFSATTASLFRSRHRLHDDDNRFSLAPQISLDSNRTPTRIDGSRTIEEMIAAPLIGIRSNGCYGGEVVFYKRLRALLRLVFMRDGG